MWTVCTQYRREMHINNSPTGSAGPAAPRSMWPSGGIIALYSDYLGHFLCVFCVPWGGVPCVCVCVCVCVWVENRVRCGPALATAPRWGKWTFPFMVHHLVFLYLCVCFLFICLLSALIAVSRWDMNRLKRNERRTVRERRQGRSCSISVPNGVQHYRHPAQ